MKKVFLGISIIAFAASCKEVPEGGNKGRLKLEAGTEHYSDDVQGHVVEEAAKVVVDSTATSTPVTPVVKDSVK